MALVVPYAFKGRLGLILFQADTVPAEYVVRLYTAVAPALGSDSVTSDFTEASDSGYNAVSLNPSDFADDSSGGDDRIFRVATPLVFAYDAMTPALGYYVTNTAGDVLHWAEEFASPITPTTLIGAAFKPEFRFGNKA